MIVEAITGWRHLAKTSDRKRKKFSEGSGRRIRRGTRNQQGKTEPEMVVAPLALSGTNYSTTNQHGSETLPCFLPSSLPWWKFALEATLPPCQSIWPDVKRHLACNTLHRRS